MLKKRSACKLLDLPVKPGIRRIFGNALYRKDRPVRQHIAVLRPRGRSEPWFPMTDLYDLPVTQLSKVFRRRMTIEQFFRDAKSTRSGSGLRLTLIRQPQRFSRFLLIFAVAYVLCALPRELLSANWG